jgi:hypothetical protein
MPPTPWQPEILAPRIWAGALRIWRTLSYSPYMPRPTNELSWPGENARSRNDA